MLAEPLMHREGLVLVFVFYVAYACLSAITGAKYDSLNLVCMLKFGSGLVNSGFLDPSVCLYLLKLRLCLLPLFPETENCFRSSYLCKSWSISPSF